MKEPGDDRNPVEVLAEEFVARIRRGERPEIEEFAAAHPEQAEDIRALFPTISQMELSKGLAEQDSPLRGPDGLPGRPERLGEFRIISEIARGGMGIVYEAEQESLHRRVALKVISRPGLLGPDRLARFEREARAAANLHHTNIVPVFGVGESDGHHYYVMQFIRGKPLDDVIREVRRLRETPGGSGERDDADVRVVLPGGETLEEAASNRRREAYCRVIARVGVQVADALRHAHSRGILHRDIKPANLLLDERGTVWVTDFGLAKLDERDDLTKSGDILGTLRYMAPETLHGEGDARSDIYSLGLTLHELLTLEPPFDEETPARLIRQVMDRRPREPRKIDPTVPRDLETIVLKATAPNPRDRYGTAEELVRDLENFLADRPIRARRATTVERLTRWCRRNPAVASLSGAAVLLLILVAVVATVGYLRTDEALGRASEQAAKAEANLRLALEAFRGILSQVEPTGLLQAESWPSGEGAETRFPPAVSDELVAILQNLLGFYERFAEENTEDPALKLEMAEAHHHVGDIQLRFGHNAQAKTAYRRALEVYDSLAVEDSASHWSERVQIHNSLGRLLDIAEKGDEARSAHQMALAILESLPAELRASAGCRLALVRTHSQLGFLSGPPRPPGRGSTRERGNGRARHAEIAHRLALELVGEDPSDPEYQLALARVYRDLGPVLWRRLNLEAPRAPRRKAIEILAKLVHEHPSKPDYLFELSLTYAGHRRPPGIFADDREEENLLIAIGYDRDLVRYYPGVPRYRLSLARHGMRLGNLLASADEDDTASAHYREAVEQLEILAARSPSVPRYRFHLSEGKYAQGRLKLKQGSLPLAVDLITAAVELLEAYLEEQTRGPRGVGLILDQYDDLARALSKLGRDDEADRAEKRAAHWRERQPPLRPPGGRGPFRRQRREP